MENELISKKDLLESAGISYGQLYRWKRKKLIPESWFIRKSTFTGQETFFPRQSILERIEKIMNLKEGASLDHLADLFSPQHGSAHLTLQQLIDRNIVSKIVLDLFNKLFQAKEEYSFTDILHLRITDSLLQQGEISIAEAELLLRTFSEHAEKLQDENMNIMLLRKMGIPLVIFYPASQDLLLDYETKIIASLSLNTFAEQLKMELS
ncbi:YhbD family protein [Fictibacillus iocasae]|uniref:YhbD family protein n=2 Tax=Fictibacillus iocasae TaxID=2715437 RepID=A0ABW2NUJ8_9BACL